MILVNASERAVQLLKKNSGLYVVSPTYHINRNGLIEQNPAPQFVPVVGVLAIVGNHVMLNNTMRFISHLRPRISGMPDTFDPESNFMICEIVAMDDYVLVYSMSYKYPDSYIIDQFYDFAGRKTDTEDMNALRLPTSRREVDALCYYGINEYMNIQRWAGANVTSIQAFPPNYADTLIGDSKVNQERALNAMRRPFENDYLIHHTGFMQDTIPEEDQKNGILSMEANPRQYYSTENRGYFDETWNWVRNDKKISPREVNEEMLQESPVERTGIPVGKTTSPAILKKVPPVTDHDGIDCIPEAAYNTGNGIVIEYKNPRTGDIIPILYDE